MNPVLTEIDLEAAEIGNDRIPEVFSNAFFNLIVEGYATLDVVGRFIENADLFSQRFASRAWTSSTDSQMALPESMISDRSARSFPCHSGEG